MRVLVTGGAGYIGGVVVAQLVEAGHDVVVYDNLSRGHREVVPSAARLVVGDVGDRTALEAAFAEHRPEAVLHFAAWIEAGESMREPEKFFRNNTANALNLLETMLAHKVYRLVFSSTAAVYGNPEHIPIRESDKLLPTNAYGESKLMVEQMLAWFHRIHGFSYAALRYFNAAGATETLGEHHQPETHLIPIVLQVASGQRSHISHLRRRLRHTRRQLRARLRARLRPGQRASAGAGCAAARGSSRRGSSITWATGRASACRK